MDMLRNDLTQVSASVRAWLKEPILMLIGGRWQPAAGGEILSVIDPTSGEPIAQVPDAGEEDIARAVVGARQAFDTGPWRQFKPVARERILLRLAELLAQHAEEFALIESLNTGRTLSNTRQLDVELSVDYLRYMAGWVTKIHGDTVEPSVPYLPDKNFLGFTLREPVGVVAAITPWNVPLGQAVWKLAPALASGCTVVLKPAEQTPLTALKFGHLVQKAGFPEGVVNIVSGTGERAGAALVRHPDIDKIAFTGSTEVGRSIGIEAASGMKRVTLELGGKSPVIILPDADLEAAIPGAAWAIFGNHGQNCLAGSRLYVHSSVYEAVVQGVCDIARNIRLGPGLDPATEMGPLISPAQQERVAGYVELGISEGAEVLAGGHAVGKPGCYFEPTVLAGTDEKMRVVQEEIFGPVLAVMSFDDEDEAIERANNSRYGLGASVWTRDIAKACRLMQRLKAGTVWVNSHGVLDLALPFGGVKQSGLGHELGNEALRHYTNIKAGMIALN